MICSVLAKSNLEDEDLFPKEKYELLQNNKNIYKPGVIFSWKQLILRKCNQMCTKNDKWNGVLYAP